MLGVAESEKTITDTTPLSVRGCDERLVPQTLTSRTTTTFREQKRQNNFRVLRWSVPTQFFPSVYILLIEPTIVGSLETIGIFRY